MNTTTSTRRWGYDRASDQFTGHDWPGALGSGFAQYALDEIEVGGRAAMALDDPEQAWWEVVGNRLLVERGR